MPIYEYYCQMCGQHLEMMQKISDAPLKDCPHCHQPGLTKQVSAPSFQLKGNGWYVTDFRGDNKANKSDATIGDAGTPGKPAETSSSKDSPSNTTTTSTTA